MSQASVLQIPKGSISAEAPYFFNVSNRRIGVFFLEEKYVAFDMQCPHLGGDLSSGKYQADEHSITCPWHGYEFDLKEGEFLNNPNEEAMCVARVKSNYFDPDILFSGKLKSVNLTVNDEFIEIDKDRIK